MKLIYNYNYLSNLGSVSADININCIILAINKQQQNISNETNTGPCTLTV